MVVCGGVDDFFGQILLIVLLGHLGEVPRAEIVVLDAGQFLCGINIRVAEERNER